MTNSETPPRGDGSDCMISIRSVSGGAGHPLSEDRIEVRYLSPKQAARYLGLSVFSIYRLVERRAIPFIPLYPSGTKTTSSSRASVRFDSQALDAWMRKQTVKPSPEYVDERTTNE
jgi:excisionase family DNA binding protein